MGLINFIDGNNDGNFRCFGMVNGFHCLGHNAVVSRHYQYGNIGYLSTSGPHGSECGMARRIQEGDGTLIDFHLISTDMLGNASGFPFGHIGMADGIQQRSFTMVYVAHNHNDWRTFCQVAVIIFLHFKEAFLNGNNDFPFYFCADFNGNHCGSIIVNDFIDRSHNS